MFVVARHLQAQPAGYWKEVFRRQGQKIDQRSRLSVVQANQA